MEFPPGQAFWSVASEPSGAQQVLRGDEKGKGGEEEKQKLEMNERGRHGGMQGEEIGVLSQGTLEC